jgi:hypothetical protein
VGVCGVEAAPLTATMKSQGFTVPFRDTPPVTWNLVESTPKNSNH